MISGLQFHYIFRLKNTWAGLPEKGWDMWEELQNIFKPDQNFANLRLALSTAPLPSIPYLGMYLSDLTFIDNEPNFIDSSKSLVNFSKMRWAPPSDYLSLLFSFILLFHLSDTLLFIEVHKIQINNINNKKDTQHRSFSRLWSFKTQHIVLKR